MIAERHVQQSQILAVLLSVENVVHVGEVLLDGVVDHLATLLLAIVSGEHHLGAERFVNHSDTLHLIV